MSALQLGRTSHRRQDEAVAAAVVAVSHLATQRQPSLEPRRLKPAETTADVPPVNSARDALLASAVELFAEHGPASVSIRDVARHAGVDHGLVRRHFGSKDDLLAEAIEVGSVSLMPGALAPGGFDIDDVVYAMHHGSPAPWMIARVLIDDIAVGRVRPRYPVITGLLSLVRRLPADARPTALADPRLAAAAGALVGGGIRDLGTTAPRGLRAGHRRRCRVGDRRPRPLAHRSTRRTDEWADDLSCNSAFCAPSSSTGPGGAAVRALPGVAGCPTGRSVRVVAGSDTHPMCRKCRVYGRCEATRLLRRQGRATSLAGGVSGFHVGVCLGDLVEVVQTSVVTPLGGCPVQQSYNTTRTNGLLPTHTTELLAGLELHLDQGERR